MTCRPANSPSACSPPGAAGLNFEDSDHAHPGTLVPAEDHAERIAVLAQAGLVVNARIDVHLNEVGDPQARLDEALRRAGLYFEAGAGCVFPILLDDEADLGAFVAAAGGPVNALLYSGSPSLARLRELGVARVSVGSGWRAPRSTTPPTSPARCSPGTTSPCAARTASCRWHRRRRGPQPRRCATRRGARRGRSSCGCSPASCCSASARRCSCSRSSATRRGRSSPRGLQADGHGDRDGDHRHQRDRAADLDPAARAARVRDGRRTRS